MERNTAASLLFLHVFALDLDARLQRLRGKVEHIVRLQRSNFIGTVAGLLQGDEDTPIPHIWCMPLERFDFTIR